jgi:hypothetical protein
MKKHIVNIRRAVCIMANELHKAGYNLSRAFKKAWRTAKGTAIKAAGVTYEGRQEVLKYLSQFRPKNLTVTLERDTSNTYDRNAIRIVVHIPYLKKKAKIGYVPKAYSSEIARLMDQGVNVRARLLGIIGGYSYKETYGALLDVAI